MFKNQDKAMAGFHSKVAENRDYIDMRLDILASFKKSVDDNHTWIEKLEAKCDRNK